MDSADFDALEERAREKLSPGAYAFAAGGADDEITLADNVAAWRRLRLRPRMLRDITAIDTSVSVLGQRLAMPLMVAPTGRHRLFHPEGERATARGAAAAGVPYVMATASTVSIEEVAAERLPAPQSGGPPRRPCGSGSLCPPSAGCPRAPPPAPPPRGFAPSCSPSPSRSTDRARAR